MGPCQLVGLAQDLPQGDAIQHVRRDHAGAQAVVQVVGGVGQLVGHVGDLGLQVAAQVGVEVAGVRDIVLRLVLDHALAHLPGEVQPGEFRVALFQLGDDAQGLPVVVEAAVIPHQPGQSHLAGVTEGGMSQVMRQADRLDQVLVAAEGTGDGPADLGDFQRVGQAGAEVVAFVVDEDLGLVFQPPEGRGVQDAVPVALERGAVFGFVVEVGAPLRVPAAHAVRRQALILDLLQLLTGEKHGHLSDRNVIASDRRERSNLLERLPRACALAMTMIKMGREGVEPSRCFHRRILSPLRLPIPPSPRHEKSTPQTARFSQAVL